MRAYPLSVRFEVLFLTGGPCGAQRADLHSPEHALVARLRVLQGVGLCGRGERSRLHLLFKAAKTDIAALTARQDSFGGQSLLCQRV